MDSSPLILFSEPREETVVIQQMTVFVSHQVLDLFSNHSSWTSETGKMTFNVCDHTLFCSGKTRIFLGKEQRLNEFEPELEQALRELSVAIGETDSWKPIRCHVSSVEHLIRHPLKIVLDVRVLAFLTALLQRRRLYDYVWNAKNGVMIQSDEKSSHTNLYFDAKDDMLYICFFDCPTYLSGTMDIVNPEDILRLKEALTELAEAVRLENALVKMQGMESL